MKKIKTKLTLWYLIVLAVALIAFSLLLYIYMRNVLFQEVKAYLGIEAEQIVKEVIVEKDRETVVNGLDSELLVAFYDRLGNKYYGETKEGIISKKVTNSPLFQIRDSKEGKWAILSKPWESGERGGYLVLARSLEREEKTLAKLLLILAFGVPLTLLLVGGGGFIIASRALSPIDMMTRIAREIDYSNLSRRIEKKDNGDEVGRLARTLNELFIRLEEASNRQKRFIADASHELRTPISVIRAQLEEILESDETSTRTKAALKIIKKQVEYMSALIRQLLLLARSDSNENRLEKERFDLRELIEVVLEEMSQLADGKGVELKKELGSGPLMISADQSKITQLLLNLLDNALEYTQSGGKVEVLARSSGKEVQIKIKDSGMGIPPAEQEKIFERFYRIDKSRSRKKGGTGLGLAISRWITEAHGGMIRVESKLGEGSTFIVTLPLNTV